MGDRALCRPGQGSAACRSCPGRPGSVDRIHRGGGAEVDGRVSGAGGAVRIAGLRVAHSEHRNCCAAVVFMDNGDYPSNSNRVVEAHPRFPDPGGRGTFAGPHGAAEARGFGARFRRAAVVRRLCGRCRTSVCGDRVFLHSRRSRAQRHPGYRRPMQMVHESREIHGPAARASRDSCAERAEGLTAPLVGASCDGAGCAGNGMGRSAGVPLPPGAGLIRVLDIM